MTEDPFIRFLAISFEPHNVPQSPHHVSMGFVHLRSVNYPRFCSVEEG